MSTTLSQTANCPNCGKPLPASAPAGLCPACLLAQGMDTDPGGKPGRFPPPPVEEIARLFLQLEILSLLGAGGMAAVYKARQPALDRFVALRAGIALEAQRTGFTFDPATHRRQQFREPGDPLWNIAMHGATDTPTGTQAATVMSHSSTDWQVEIVSVDQTGKTRPHRLVSGSGLPSGGELMVWTYMFIGVPLKEVKEFRVAVHHLRKRYRALLRDEIAQSLADPAQVEAELRTLLAALAA